MVARSTHRAEQVDGLLLGEWACLGLLAERPSHGFALARHLEPEGDLGRIWTLSRPYTYRCLDTLVAQRLVRSLRDEPGTAGGQRTVLSITAAGRRRLDPWLETAVPHLRNVRDVLLVKLQLLANLSRDPGPLICAQRDVTSKLEAALRARVGAETPPDHVLLWRVESAAATLRFLDSLAPA